MPRRKLEDFQQQSVVASEKRAFSASHFAKPLAKRSSIWLNTRSFLETTAEKTACLFD
jgi:hypothetical protein